jgi:hypothetical protein
MANFYKPDKQEFDEALWKKDLTDWLIKCKGVSDPSRQELSVWDEKFRASESEYDLDRDSFCKYTGWICGNPGEPPLSDLASYSAPK